MHRNNHFLSKIIKVKSPAAIGSYRSGNHEHRSKKNGTQTQFHHLEATFIFEIEHRLKTQDNMGKNILPWLSLAPRAWQSSFLLDKHRSPKRSRKFQSLASAVESFNSKKSWTLFNLPPKNLFFISSFKSKLFSFLSWSSLKIYNGFTFDKTNLFDSSMIKGTLLKLYFFNGDFYKIDFFFGLEFKYDNFNALKSFSLNVLNF